MQRIRIFIAQIEQFALDVPISEHEAWELRLLVQKLEAKLTENKHEQLDNGEH